MGTIRAHRRVVGDPEAPRVDAPVAGDAGAGAVAYLVGGDRSACQDPEGGIPLGARVRAVQLPGHTQGCGQAGRAFGQFLVVSGRESTLAGVLGALDDLAGPEQDRARPALGTACLLYTSPSPRD